ncbi:MAG: DUF3833 domain-containing protein [Quisquiliibacterium sp.]
MTPTTAQSLLSKPLRKIAATMAAISGILLPGCASINPAEYASQKPELSLERYFSGTIDGWGMFQDRSGKVVRRFTVVIKAQWSGDTGTLDEDFKWSDGENQKRVWTLKRIGEGRYLGTAADVVGQAQGVVSGNALHWRYAMTIPVDGRTWQFNFDDWMFLVDERVLLNRAVMSKFGIRLGEVTLSMTKRQ